MAKSQGLKALAITDHDTVDGVAEASAEADALGIEIIPGVEISASFGDVPIHVLGLFLRCDEPWLVDFFAEASRRRIARVHEMVDKLSRLGVSIEADEVFARSSHGTVGRPHVAEVLIARRFVADRAEAFARYLGEDCPAFVGYEKVSLEDAVDIITRAGGIASLAHPYVIDARLIPQMAARSLPGLEVYHRDHTPEHIAEYEKLSEELGLLRTGGSDFHAHDGDEPVPLGCPQLTDELFEGLRAAAAAT